MYDKTNVHYRSKGKTPLMFNKTNVYYRSKVKNRLFYDKTYVHYRIRGKDALVRAIMGKLTPQQPWMTRVTTRAR